MQLSRLNILTTHQSMVYGWLSWENCRQKVTTFFYIKRRPETMAPNSLILWKSQHFCTFPTRIGGKFKLGQHDIHARKQSFFIHRQGAVLRDSYVCKWRSISWTVDIIVLHKLVGGLLHAFRDRSFDCCFCTTYTRVQKNGAENLQIKPIIL